MIFELGIALFGTLDVMLIVWIIKMRGCLK